MSMSHKPGGGGSAIPTEVPRSTERPLEPDAGRESVRPEAPSQPAASDSAAPPARHLPEEPPAAERLAADEASAAWQRRADWLEAEAKATQDAPMRARLLLAASEVRAMLGARRDARRLALSAASHTPTPPFAARQARALCQGQGDSSVVMKGLRDEARSEKHPAARAHAQYLAAEVARLWQRDGSAAEAYLEAADQIEPPDCRASLQRLARQLAQSQKPPDVRFRPDEMLHPLRQATAQIGQLRGSEAPRVDGTESTAVALIETQRALGRGKLAEAALALSALESQAGLRGAVRWLATSWRAAVARPGDEALGTLRQLVRDNPGRLERRALASRALRTGDVEALREALGDSGREGGSLTPSANPRIDDARRGESDAARTAFSAAEYLSLGALAGDTFRTSPAEGAPSLDAPSLRPLEVALERLHSPAGQSGSAPTPLDAEFALGRSAARLERFRDFEPTEQTQSTSIWSTLLRLERARETNDLPGLAALLPQLTAQPNAAAEAHFVSAVLCERSGDVARAKEHYQAALLSTTTREPAVRALAVSSPDTAAALFRSLSAHASDPLRRALLLTEALFRLNVEAPEFDAIAEDAARTDPSLPFAYQLGELGARMRGDRTRVARWLGRQREQARDPHELTLAAVREALFLAQTDSLAAAERLATLPARRGLDIALEQLYERLADVPPAAAAQFRLRAARASTPHGRQAWLAEAVERFRRAGDARAALEAARELESPLGELWVEELSTEPADLEWLSNRWGRLASEASDIELASDYYRRSSHLELSRGSGERAAAWQRARLALAPDNLLALRFLQIDSMRPGHEGELQRCAAVLAQTLSLRDAAGDAFVAARMLIDRGAFPDARPFAQRICSLEIPPLWALRLESTFARDAGDDARLLAICRTLRERAQQPIDQATLSLRAGEALARLGQLAAAGEELLRARAGAKDSVVILALRAEVLQKHADHADAAEAFETLSSLSSSPSKRVDALYQAAVLWLDALGDRARGVLALQEAAAILDSHPGVTERLRQITGSLELADSDVESRRAEASAPPEVVEREIARAQSLARSGAVEAGLAVLADLRLRQPPHAALLHAAAELSVRAHDWSAAEAAWKQVLELTELGPLRLGALWGLAGLYERELPDPSRAQLAYLELLRADPDELTVRRRLVRSLASAGREEDALAHQRELVQRARGDEERRQYLLELVESLGKTPSGQPEAQALLERAHRTWPDSAQVLRAEIDHYRQSGDQNTARVIVERATHSARNAIQAGRLDAALFRTLEVATELGGDPDTAGAARAALAAIRGQALDHAGASASAGQVRFDDLLAPAPVSPAFRRLLYAAGAAIERAYAPDPTTLGASMLPEPEATRVRNIAAQFGLDDVRVMVSAEVGCDCICVHAEPLYVVFGQRLLEHPEPRVRDFLLFRALKLAQTNSSALSRMSPSDLWATLAGFLACFAEPWRAEGGDARRLVAARNRIRPHITATLAPELYAMTSAITANIVPQTAEVGEALWRWAARVALLGVGEVGVAFQGLWAAANLGPALPSDVDGRVRWIASDRQARDLVGYGVSEAYIEARRRAGLSLTQP
jgi:hypothetical protein